MKILLLSDIHLINVVEEHDAHSTKRSEFLKDIKNYCDLNGKFDYVFFNGDIANTGNFEEYKKADAFIEDLCNVLQIDIDKIFVIPGNHDKNYSADNKSLRAILHAGLSNDKCNENELYYNLIKDDFASFIKLIFNPFQAYYRFSTRYDSIAPFMSKCLSNPQKLPDIENNKFYIEKMLGQINGYDLYLYCFNSALISDCNDYSEEKKDGHKQFLPDLCYSANVKNDNKINVLLMHHPLEYINDKNNTIKDSIESNFQIQIYGHLHKSATSNTKCIVIDSGAFQPYIMPCDSEKYFSVYNIIDLDVIEDDKQNPSLSVNLDVEKYNADTKSFEKDLKESKKLSIALKNRQNRWEKSRTETIKLPSDVTLRKVRIEFMKCKRKKTIMRQFNFQLENNDISLFNSNCINFLNYMEQNNLMNELWQAMKKQIK